MGARRKRLARVMACREIRCEYSAVYRNIYGRAGTDWISRSRMGAFHTSSGIVPAECVVFPKKRSLPF